MESPVKCNGDQRRRPDTVTRVYQESPDKSGETVAAEIGGYGGEELVQEVSGVALVEVLETAGQLDLRKYIGDHRLLT